MFKLITNRVFDLITLLIVIAFSLLMYAGGFIPSIGAKGYNTAAGDATAPLNVAMVKLETKSATAITATQSATSAGAFAVPALALAVAATASHWRI